MDKTAKQHLKEAIAHYKAGRYEKALAACESAIELDPTCGRAYHGKGLVLSRKVMYFGELYYQEALESYQKSNELVPNNARLYADMGELHFTLNEYEKAGSYFRKAIELNTKYQTLYASYANQMIEDAFRIDNSGFERSQAIAAFQQAIIFNPADERICYYLSNLQITKSPYDHYNLRITSIDTTPCPPGPSSSHPYSCRCTKCVEGSFEDRWINEIYREDDDD